MDVQIVEDQDDRLGIGEGDDVELCQRKALPEVVR